MPVSLTHDFVSAQPDSPDSTLISTSEWNDTHRVQATGVGVAGNFSGDVGPVEIIGFAGNLAVEGGQLVLAGIPEFTGLTLATPLGLGSGGSGESTDVDALTALDLDLTGSLTFAAVNVTPAGYIKANGAAVSRTTYARLFARIGTEYGAGDGVTTFNLPDLRGEFLRGWDDGRGVDSGRAVASAQAAQIATHTHPFSGTVSTVGNHTHRITDQHGEGNGSLNVRVSNARMSSNTTGGFGTYSGGSHAHSFSGTTSSAGVETRPANMPLVAYIKF